MVRRSTASRLRATAAVLGVLSLPLVACSGDDPSPATSTTTTVPPLEEPLVGVTGGTVADGATGDGAAPSTPPADKDTRALAKAAVLRSSDFASAWSVHTKGGTLHPSDSSCSYVEDGPEARLGLGAARRGATMQLGDRPAFVTSTSYVFPDEQSAIDWIGLVRSDEWAECTAAAYAEEVERRGWATDVTVETREIDHLGSKGFEAYAELHAVDDADRPLAVISVLHYRNGRVVIEGTLERSTALGDGDWAAVDTAHSAAVATAWSRLNAAL